MNYFNKYDTDLTKPLNNIDKMEAIESWQENAMHPLTCSNCRKNLHDDLIDGEVVLKCMCGYIQKYVPEVVYERYKRLLIGEDE